MYSFSHPDTFITLGELAGVLRDQDKLEEAQSTYEMLLENRIRVLGEVSHRNGYLPHRPLRQSWLELSTHLLYMSLDSFLSITNGHSYTQTLW